MSSRVHTVAPKQQKYKANRPHDYLYDPVFVVSGAKDFNKCAIQAIKTSAEFKICPVYPSMFTDLGTYPRNQLAIKSLGNVPKCIDKSWEGRQRYLSKQYARKMDVIGTDRHQFFRRPMVPFLHPVLPPLRFGKEEPVPDVRSKTVEKSKTCSTQTDYRESETQTTPWAPPYEQMEQGNLEILTLAHLSWGNGLPAGMHEVEIIERARIKRAWEASLPPMTDATSIEKRKLVIEMMEQDEWAFREKEIDHLNDMRMKLANALLSENQAQMSDKRSRRLNRYWETLQRAKDKKIAAIRKKTNRDLRKLRLKHEGVNKKYHKVDVVEDHDDRKSEWYGPQMRFGEHPKRAHEVIHCRSEFLTTVKGIEVLERVPEFLPGFDHLRVKAPKKEWHLCIRETRWTEPVLKKLHEDLQRIRLHRVGDTSAITLVMQIPKPISPPVTPSVEGFSDWDEEQYQSALVLQKTIKGRSVQTLMYKGRDKCSELIEELKSTHALNEAGLLLRNEERFEVKSQQRMQMLEKRRMDRLSEVLSTLEGQTVGSSLDFLCKELWRLQDERCAHAFALLAERERHRREAAEAGRRQFEERRRREHDEMFKQVVKVHQDTVDIYLEDLILESMDWVAEDEARKYVRQLAKRVDQAAQEAYDRSDCLEREELVADLIHNFVLPEAEKQRIREKMKARQGKYLRAAHETIYETIDDLPPPTPSAECSETIVSALQESAKDIDSIAIESSTMLADIETICSQLVDNAIIATFRADSFNDETSEVLNEESEPVTPLDEDKEDEALTLFSRFITPQTKAVKTFGFNSGENIAISDENILEEGEEENSDEEATEAQNVGERHGDEENDSRD